MSSEHRDKSKFTELPEHRVESKIRKVIKNIETDKNPRKATKRKVIKSIEMGQNAEKVVRKIEMDEQDRNRRQKSGHE